MTYDNQPVTTGQIIGLYNGTQQFKENLTNGTIISTFTPQNIGPNDIKIWYISPGDTYNTIGVYKKVTAKTLNTTLTIEADNVTTGEIATVIAKIYDENNNIVENRTVIFRINNTEHNVTIHNSTAILSQATNETWIDGISARFYQTITYNPSATNTIKIVNPGDIKITMQEEIEGDNVIIRASLTDINNIPINSGYARFYNETSSISNVRVQNGTATLTLPKNKVTESMIITLNFTNSRAFNNKKENLTLSLNPPLISLINIDPVIAKANEEVTITATVITKEGMPVNEGCVTFATSDYVETVNVENGIATTTHVFTQALSGTLQATYTPNDDNDYYPSTNMTTIRIIKDVENTCLNINEVTGKVNEEVTIIATVTTEDGMPVDEGSVTFTTADYTETVNVVDGVASTTHTFTEALSDTLTAIYTPDNPEDYNPSSNITTITVICLEYILKVDTTTCTLVQANTITASIYYGNQVATNINKGKVTFKVNGKTLKDSNGKVIYASVINGTATIDYLIPDTWNSQTTIQAVYSGTIGIQSLKSDKETITITKIPPTITLNDITATRGQNITINVQVTQDQNPVNTGKIIIKINGKTIKDANGKVIFATVNDGIATVTYMIPESMKVNDYSLTAVFTYMDNEKIEVTRTLTVLST